MEPLEKKRQDRFKKASDFEAALIARKKSRLPVYAFGIIILAIIALAAVYKIRPHQSSAFVDLVDEHSRKVIENSQEKKKISITNGSFEDEGESSPKGTLYVETTPGSARVKILDKNIGFYQNIKLDAGKYHVQASAEGYETKDEWISLAIGEKKRHEIRLKEKDDFIKKLNMKFVYINPGSFLMGSSSSEAVRDIDEKQHNVTLTKGFYMQTTEVTQGQWYDVMGTKPWSDLNYVFEGRDYPATYVSWEDIQKFINKLNEKAGKSYRLPTESEWEYACRAGSTTRFYFGDNENNLGSYAWYDKNAQGIGEEYAHKVGQKRPNNWGIYDMNGNVWEWCQDWYFNEYPQWDVTDPMGWASGSSSVLRSGGSRRVMRGGSWSCFARSCRSADRYFDLPGSSGNYLGFRLVGQ